MKVLHCIECGRPKDDHAAAIAAGAEFVFEEVDVCGEAEPNQSSANRAVCDLPPDHPGPWHTGFARGPAAAERPGPRMWALVAVDEARHISEETWRELEERP